MKMRPHRYEARLRWSGAAAGPAREYAAYSRAYAIEIAGKPALYGSADPHFHGDAAAHNPEDLLVGALAACHLLSYLAACTRAGVTVVAYDDQARGEMTLVDGKIRFREVVLAPQVVIAAGDDPDLALQLHDRAHAECFIANSVNFPVRHEAAVRVVEPA